MCSRHLNLSIGVMDLSRSLGIGSNITRTTGDYTGPVIPLDTLRAKFVSTHATI
jgi:hypothetical protein